MGQRTQVLIKYDVYVCVCVCVCVCVLVTQSCPTLCNPMDCSLPGSSVHRIPRQEYWNGLPFPSPDDIQMANKHMKICFTSCHQGNANWNNNEIPLHTYGTPLQYSCLQNPMHRGFWRAAVHGAAEGWTRLSDFTFTFHFHALEKEMATHSSVLAWRIPGTEEPCGLLSMGRTELDTTEVT